jgi:hypothetical protein
MKASEIIKQLQKIVDKKGDCDVYYDYDDGVRVKCNEVDYVKNIAANNHSEHWGTIDRGIVFNYTPEEF